MVLVGPWSRVAKLPFVLEFLVLLIPYNLDTTHHNGPTLTSHIDRLLTPGTIIAPVIGIVPHMNEMNVDVIIAPATISIVLVIVDVIVALTLTFEIGRGRRHRSPCLAIIMIWIGDNPPTAAPPGTTDMDL